MGSDERVSGVVELNIGGHRLAMRLDLPTEPVKPHRALPIFQQMTNSFVDLSVKAVEAQGETMSCKEGCGACCRQPVPISELEVYQIAELVESMPEPRRSEIKNRFSDACEHFARIGWFEKIAACDEVGKTEGRSAVAETLRELIDEYFREGISCPFLEAESCSIHPSRPLVCREYAVTSPPENCSRLDRQAIRPIQLLVNPSTTVQFLGRTGRMGGLGLLPLIRALELAERFPEAFEEKKAEEWIGEFFDRLSVNSGTGENPAPAAGKSPGKKRKPKKALIFMELSKLLVSAIY
jgi:Fe-S-cluster containining protein